MKLINIFITKLQMREGIKIAIKFEKLIRANMRNLKAGEKLIEYGIIFERLVNGDGRFSVNIMVDGQRVYRTVGTESDGTTRTQAKEFIQKAKQDAKEGRLNLPKGRKLALSFSEAAEKYITKLKAEGGKDITKKQSRLNLHIMPTLKILPWIRSLALILNVIKNSAAIKNQLLQQ